MDATDSFINVPRGFRWKIPLLRVGKTMTALKDAEAPDHFRRRLIHPK
jgi:hypothetical protein